MSWVGPNGGLHGYINNNQMSVFQCDDNRPNRYGIDSVGLQQLGFGLPLQMLGPDGVEIVTPALQELHIGSSSAPFSKSGVNESSETEIKLTIDGIPIRKLYVTNIAPEHNEQGILHIFARFGAVYHIFLGTKQHTNIMKKFAFVTYRNPKDATKVLQLGKLLDYRNRLIFVAAADSWHQPQEGPNGEIVMPSRFQETRPLEESIIEEDSGVVERVVEVAQEDGLNSLNDDCLLHIFSFLSYKEIMGVERVCKRWQGLSYRMWKSLHELNLSKPPFNKTRMKVCILDQFLKRCGEFLRLLELTGKNNDLTEAAVAIVAKYCTNLEVLRVENISLGNRSLAHLGRRCQNLKQLTIDQCNKFNDNDLMSLLPKCSKLSELSISKNSFICGKFLNCVQGPITSLEIHKCSHLHPDFLIAGVIKMRETLQRLSLSGPGQDKVEEVLKAVPNLTSLSLCQPIYNLVLVDLKQIGELAKLTSLDLSQNYFVNNAVIAAIVAGCEQLTHLNLTFAGSGSGLYGSLDGENGEGLSMIGRLRKLTHLQLSYIEKVNDSVLKNITKRNSRLKELVCRGCTEITDCGCSQVVSMCNEMELFDLSGCEVGSTTVSAALTSVKMRTNNVPLKLIMGGTWLLSAELPEGTEPSPLLTIDMTNHDNEQMRLDNDSIFFSDDFSDDGEHNDNLCCDCDFELGDDLYDPTLFPSDFDDDSPKFGGFEDDYDEDALENWTDSEDNDDDELYAFQLT